MTKLVTMWNNRSLFFKYVLVVRIVLGVLIIILCLLGLNDIVDIMVTNNIVMPAMCAMFVLNGIDVYKHNKVIAYINYVTAGGILLITLFVFGVHLFV